LAISLINDRLFLNEFLRYIIKDDYDNLFISNSESDEIKINIQVDTSELVPEDYSKVYAVAMTADKNLIIGDLLNLKPSGKEKNITDIIIEIKGVLIIIEVKRTGDNCINQLRDQLIHFDSHFENKTVYPISFPWQEVIKILEKVNNFYLLCGKRSVFIEDYIRFLEANYPNWFGDKALSLLQFSTNDYQIKQRLRRALQHLTEEEKEENYTLSENGNRFGLKVGFGWADEILIELENYNDDIKEYVTFYIYPGNTIQQIKELKKYNSSWRNKEKLLVDFNKKEYMIKIEPHIKFSHIMGKYITEISEFKSDDLKEPIYDDDMSNNLKYSKQWKKDEKNAWKELEDLFDKHFKEEYNWREKCKWEEKILRTDKTFVNLSFGYFVTMYVPYKDLQDIDKDTNNIKPLADFLNSVVESFRKLVN